MLSLSVPPPLDASVLSQGSFHKLRLFHVISSILAVRASPELHKEMPHGHAACEGMDKIRVRGCMPVFAIRACCIRTEKCVSICPHFTVQRHASDRPCFIVTADLKRTCSVRCTSINQRLGLSLPSYLGINGIENEIPDNEHLVEKVNNLAGVWEMKKQGPGDL